MFNVINYDVTNMNLTVDDYESYLKYLDHMKNDKIKYSKLKSNDKIVINHGNNNSFRVKDITNENITLVIIDTKVFLRQHYIFGNKKYIKTKFYFDDDDTREKAKYLNSTNLKEKTYKIFNDNEIIVPIKDIKKLNIYIYNSDIIYYDRY